MASWIKNTFLDFIGVDSPDPTPTTQRKRKASEEGSGPSKAKRYNDDAYRNAPYETLGPSRPRKEHSENPETVAPRELRMRQSLDDLERQFPSVRVPKTLEPIDQLKSQLVAECDPSREYKSVPRVRPTGSTQGRVQKLQQVELSPSPLISEELDSDEDVNIGSPSPEHVQPLAGKIPRPQTSVKMAQVPKKTTRLPTTKVGPTVVEEPWKEGITTEEQWATRPNKRARELLSAFPTQTRVKRAIQKEVKEPEYALRDVEIRDGLWHLMDLMERLTKKFFNFEVPPHVRKVYLESFFREFSPETAKVIGCVASGGPGGVEGWHDLFINEQKRRALVLAIIGNVLVEQVFQHMFFGGIAKHIKRLTDLQNKYRNEDGKCSQQRRIESLELTIRRI